MEGFNNESIVENFEKFRITIQNIYKIDGWSENLRQLIDTWYEKGYRETDDRGVRIIERLLLDLERVKIYISLGRMDEVGDWLNLAFTQALNESYNKEAELDNAKKDPNKWFEKVRSLRGDLVGSMYDEMASIDSQLKILTSLIEQIENIANSIGFELEPLG